MPFSDVFRPVLLTTLLTAALTTGCEKRTDPPAPVVPTPGEGVGLTTDDGSGTESAPAPTDATPEPAPTQAAAPVRLPRHWFETDINSWVGKQWQELDLVRFLRERPEDLSEGEHFLVYYSRTCDHCEQMFRNDFRRNTDLAAKVIAIEIPESTSVMTAPNAWAMPQTQVRQLLQLPMETNWIITAPLVVRIVDGVVQCAQEGDHKTCMNL